MEDFDKEKVLEEFVLNNPDLDKLERMLETFNVFETLNMVNVEIKHSNFLAWMFNPNENHSLGSYFLKQFLKTFYSINKSLINSEVSLFDFEIFDYSDVEIRREWNNIDVLILIRDEGIDNKNVAIIIENKIKSPETNDQLKRYKKIVNNEFPNYSKFFIFLTPEDAEPSDDEWIPFKYEYIADLLEDILLHRNDYLSNNVYNFIVQYKIILRRYLVGNGEIEEICRKIYNKHQKALDLIFEYKPDLELEVSEYLAEVLSKFNLEIDSTGKTYNRFTTKILDKKIEKLGEGWTKSGRIFLYEIENSNKKLYFRLSIGPGNQDYREILHKFCMENPNLFNVANRKMNPKWHAVMSKTLLSNNEYIGGDIEILKPKIENNFAKFVSNEMKEIDRYFEEKWNG